MHLLTIKNTIGFEQVKTICTAALRKRKLIQNQEETKANIAKGWHYKEF
jgi:hypothetical protein